VGRRGRKGSAEEGGPTEGEGRPNTVVTAKGPKTTYLDRTTTTTTTTIKHPPPPPLPPPATPPAAAAAEQQPTNQQQMAPQQATTRRRPLTKPAATSINHQQATTAVYRTGTKGPARGVYWVERTNVTPAKVPDTSAGSTVLRLLYID
jgi:hypothetical protein